MNALAQGQEKTRFYTRAIKLLRAGVPVTAVQQLLGHADVATTAVYLRLSGMEIRRIRGVL
ncbi:MAG TPA: hypothetical protein ENJ96_02010 [Thermodesulfatator atlanticus]|uniref:Tyr recombinase domain-containing protein n=1 Tax=Thermodesulfatator atlanticus TaxID=501497 RepID=A0A7V5NZ05_9BACT|nr:hypothetical protein [Thermodesulfatator atlanticus]